MVFQFPPKKKKKTPPGFSLIITISRVGAAKSDKFQLTEDCKQSQTAKLFPCLASVSSIVEKFMHFSNENENFPMYA